MQVRICDLKKSYDYIIIGAGIIGITILRELIKKGKKNILMIESGSMLSSDPYPSYQNIISRKLKIKKTSQFSGVGGGSNVWGSISGIFNKQLINKSFNAKKFPLNYSDYKYYLEKTLDYGFPRITEFENIKHDNNNIKSKKFVQVTPKVKFFHFSSILENENVDFIQNCYVEEIIKTVQNQKKIKFLTKNKFYFILGKKIILCANTIENYKLLKKSNLNLNYEILGKGFMNHPKGVIGTLNKKKVFDRYISKISKNRISYNGIQLRKSNYNHYLKINNGFKIPILHYLSKKISGNLKYYDGNLVSSNNLLKSYFLLFTSKLLNISERIINKFYKDYVYIELFSEMKFYHKNMISYNKDSNQTYLTYELSKKELESISELIDIFEKTFNCNIKFKPKTISYLKKIISIDASHHMGGIVCGESKDQSVLNLKLSLHEEKDIIVCGGGCFPFSGVANPTMSYVALAIWLTEKHL
tara:strand:- start:11323 stop:12738 length:1416 start_codon:yes stop_codon:yes gene_type:complete